MKEIEGAYTRMASRYHPDVGGKHPQCTERMKRPSWAYRLPMSYCTCGGHTFEEEDVFRAYAE